MVIINYKNINLKDTIESGQCFRYNIEEDNSYTLVIVDRIVNIKQSGDKLYVKSNIEKNLNKVITNYLDLNTDYNKLNKEMKKRNSLLDKYIKLSKGFKILRQDPFETLISYIISANNNVARISGIVNSIAKKYGEKVEFENKVYYLFPTPKKLKDITLEDLKIHKLGYRDKYIIDAISKITSNEIKLKELDNVNTKEALNILESIKGIGPKVASCILLFAYHRFNVFPIDTWVKKTIKNDFKYIEANAKSITKFAEEEFGEYSGLAIQYMYHASRNKEV